VKRYNSEIAEHSPLAQCIAWTSRAAAGVCLVLLLGSCGQTVSLLGINPDEVSLSGTAGSDSGIQLPCGETEVRLIAAQDIEAGTVEIKHDSEMLSVTVRTGSDWLLLSTKLHLACSPSEIPQTKKGNPIPGKFVLKTDFAEGVTASNYMISLTELDFEPGMTIYLALYAEVAPVNGGTLEGAWAEGDEFEGSNWGMYFDYEITECFNIYFLSDESGRLNLWKGYLGDAGIQDRVQLTHYTNQDIRHFKIDERSGLIALVIWPTGAPSGDLHVSELETISPQRVPNLPNSNSRMVLWTDDGTMIFSEGATVSYNSILTIASILPNGSGYVRLTEQLEPSGYKSHKRVTSWTADGLYFSSTRQWSLVENNWDIWFRDNTGSYSNLTNTAGTGESYPILSPDGSTLAIRTSNTYHAHGRYIAKSGISIMPSSGGSQNILIPKTEGLYVRPMQWLSDGRILYAAFNDDPREPIDLFTINLDDSIPVNITNTDYIGEVVAQVLGK